MIMDKFQKNILDKLLKNERVYAQELNDGRVILSDGVRAYMFYGDLYIDIHKCVITSNLDCFFEKKEDDELITSTWVVKKTTSHYIAEYKKQSGELVYIDKRFVKDTLGLNMYASSSNTRVLCENQLGMPIMVMMPIRA